MIIFVALPYLEAFTVLILAACFLGDCDFVAHDEMC